MSVSRFSLIIALLPSRNIQKWGKMSRFLHWFPTEHGIIWPKAWQCPPWINTFSALCRRIIQPLSSYCLSLCLVLSNLSRRILYLFVLRQKHPSSDKTLPDSSRFSNLFAIFATSFRNYSGGTEWLYRKGVIEIIFISLKFSQSLNWNEDGGNSTTSFGICIP